MAAPRTRRAPGAGHLFVKRTAAGRESWYAKWYVDGRQVMRKVGPKRSQDGHGLDRREAERKLRKLMEEVTPPPSSRVSVQEAGERLIEHLRALGRNKPSTIESYESMVRVHLASYFAGRSLDSIGTDDLEAFIRAKAADGRSAKTTANVLRFLHSIFAFGQRKGWARSNPCTLIDKPRDDGAKTDIRFLDPDDLEAVIRAEADGSDELAPTLALAYRAAGMTGLRMGELIGLRWRDVDWTAARVRVRQSHVRGEYSTPKSKRGSRSVPLADELAGELERHFQRSKFTAEDALVMPHPVTGHPLDRSKLRKRFKAALRAAGVREVRFHDLRHTFGTRMAAVGVPMRTLMEWMGHADITTTLIYADYAPSERERGWVEAAFTRQAAVTKTAETRSSRDTEGTPR